MSITAFAICTLGLLQGQGSDTVATINGEALTGPYYHRRMEYLPGLGRRTNTGQFIEIMPAIATLDTLVTEMLILQIAKSKGLTPTETEVDQEISYRIRVNSNYVKDWQAVGRTLPEMRHMIKVERAQFKIQTDGIVVTESDVQRNYDASKATRYTLPVRLKLRVIIVHDEEAKSLVDTGLKGGKAFEEMAKTYSTDPSKLAGGEFGTVPIDLLGDEVKAAVKPLKNGEQTGWLGKDATFAKFKVDLIYPEALIPLDVNLKEGIRREMMLIKGSGRVDIAKLVRDARLSANISIMSPEIDKAYKQFLELEKSAKNGG